LALAREQLRDTLLRAPFDGTVLEILRREGDGQRLIDSEPVLVFGDLRRLRVRAEIDERYARRIRPGQQALVYGRGLREDTFRGRVAQVRPMMGKKTVFSRAATERRDLGVIQVEIEPGKDFCAPVGLQVDVKILIRN
jgi:HlyD family secretion protein